LVRRSTIATFARSASPNGRTLPSVCVAPIVLIRVGVIDLNFVTTAPTGCNFGAGPNCMVTGVPLDLGFTGPWIAASGF
jgi:hypothetical protein